MEAMSVAASSMLKVRPVKGRRELSAFIRLPRKLYRGMPGFVPPLDLERRQMLHPAHAPLFERAEVQYWLAWREGRPVGRISAQIDPLALQAWGAPIGMFGCLDAVDDRAVVTALIEEAAGWLAARGMTRMRGPFLLSINGEPGLQIEGQDRPAMLLMPWHPTYLAGHVTAAGLSPVKDLLAYSLSLAERAHNSKLRIPQILTGRVSIRPLDHKQIASEAEALRSIFNDAWRRNWGHVPLTANEVDKLTKALRPLIYSDSIVFAEKDREPVAFALVLPNLYDIVRDFDGHLLPFNWMRLGWRLFRRSFHSARVLLMGVRSELQFSVFGAILPLLMIEELIRRARHFQIDEIEMGWILEDNERVRSLIEANGGTLSRRYRLFECDLGHTRR